ncbi:MAG: ethanolamine ammonia-lyase reactivating factor EutA [Caldilinea sp.]|nr:ethanolamine ammonia-lyase reactivating factor EutA [Caldilinea sp.]
MDAPVFLSVGIDVGTTTTQLLFSELQTVNVAQPGQIPRLEIVVRRVLYRSPVVLTPLSDPETVDAPRLYAWVQAAYAAAGVAPAQIETGAVIVTGETAKKQNADRILAALAGLAGEFVVSVAGPHLEGALAGRGSGAAAYARHHFTTVTNIDIGGGTANRATFQADRLLTTAAINCGGRLLELDGRLSRVRSVAEPARTILAACGLQLVPGDLVDLATLRRFTDQMAALTVELIHGTASPLAQQLYLTAPAPPVAPGTLLMFSGGVGSAYYAGTPAGSVAEVALYGDVGPLLADSLRRQPDLAAYTIAEPSETVRATVLGAGTQTVTVSGSTIWVERALLPLRNLPVVQPALPAEWERTALAAAIRAATLRGGPANEPCALALECGQPLEYPALLELAAALCTYADSLPPQQPLVVLLDRDYAQVLGQTIKAALPKRPLLVIDQVQLAEGNYLDVGLPLLDGRVVPLSIKTLVFYR